MNGQELTFTLVALLVMALLSAALLLFVMSLRKALHQQQREQAILQADLRALCNAAVQVGERLNRSELQLKLLRQRQQELGVRQEKMAQVEHQEPGFEQAIKLARKGSSVDELMEICNLSRGEAELIAMMHRLEPKA